MSDESDKRDQEISDARLEGWQLAHDPSPCGHPRACWLDRNWPASHDNYDPVTKTSNPPLDYRCVMCEMKQDREVSHIIAGEFADFKQECRLAMGYRFSPEDWQWFSANLEARVALILKKLAK